ncbi:MULTISPECIES: MarR family winged helix-turn-helix transcriptional regulator [Mycolicibacterium]|uniref:Transcriptional regulator n=1 Tax=Mycolicibacterium cosmeticum TaxID=258533 RepID=W9APJ2_MYCCO|nr:MULTISPECIES: MarR family winged helix-turn-helix transcriptional regulator [Mycolicibacterium]MDX1871084.1 MarR family winged helix-turn-helix transcriptional regulator [Mycolicibacterium sp. 120266]CDO07408.1 transcriptional regulator [Mycolicibacterium cosmeticum]
MSTPPRQELLLGPLLDLVLRRLRGTAEAEIAKVGLRTRHIIALTLLRDFGEQGQAGLADSLGIDPTNVVILLNELESAGLAERRRSPEDRRRHTVVVTETGAARLAEAEKALATMEHHMFGALTHDELSTLHGLLQRAAEVTAGKPETPPAVSCTGEDH